MTNDQKRNYVRLEVKILFEYYKVSDDAVLQDRFSAITNDLSGGGLRFNSKVELEIDTELELSLNIPGKGKISVGGKVVRCFPLERVTGFSVGVEFTIIDKTDREKLIRFIFERQRELRQRGLI